MPESTRPNETPRRQLNLSLWMLWMLFVIVIAVAIWNIDWIATRLVSANLTITHNHNVPIMRNIWQ